MGMQIVVWCWRCCDGEVVALRSRRSGAGVHWSLRTGAAPTAEGEGGAPPTSTLWKLVTLRSSPIQRLVASGGPPNTCKWIGACCCTSTCLWQFTPHRKPASPQQAHLISPKKAWARVIREEGPLLCQAAVLVLHKGGKGTRKGGSHTEQETVQDVMLPWRV